MFDIGLEFYEEISHLVCCAELKQLRLPHASIADVLCAQLQDCPQLCMRVAQLLVDLAHDLRAQDYDLKAWELRAEAEEL